MRAGRLRHMVELQRATVTTDSHGDQVQAWETLAEVHAEVLPISGREMVQASQVMADVNFTIRLRAYPELTLTPKDRIKFGERIFDIRHIVDWGGRGVEWQVFCTERY